jgi:hypothetical protein
MSSNPAVHSVHFYETHESLIDRLAGVVCSGLGAGNAVLIVATGKHREQLVNALERADVDVEIFVRDKRFRMYDAEALLSTFMVNGLPDERRFMISLGKHLLDAKSAAINTEQGITVFGEMVAVLWEEGNKKGALALENLWNDVLDARAFHLHCAYPRALFSADQMGLLNVCESHSHILGVLTPGLAAA